MNPLNSLDDINNYFGDLDLFLLDQLLKGNIRSGKVLELGFGDGRNLLHFLQAGYEVHGVDLDPSSIALMKAFAKNLKQGCPENFIKTSATDLPYDDAFFDTVICCRLFHFLSDQDKKIAWHQIHRVLRPNGICYFTANSTINFEHSIVGHEEGQHSFPDGTQGYMLNQKHLSAFLTDSGFKQIEPTRHIQYDDQHAETILVLQKN